MEDLIDDRMKFRAGVRKLVEEFANATGSEGVVTSWGLVAIVSSHDETDACPCEEVWVDSADFNDFMPPPWRRKALFMVAADAIRMLED